MKARGRRQESTKGIGDSSPGGGNSMFKGTEAGTGMSWRGTSGDE